MNRFGKILLIMASILYPIAVFTALYVFHASPRVFVFAFLAIAVLYFVANSGNAKKKGIKGVQFWGMVVILLSLSTAVFIFDNMGIVKAYPLLVASLLFVSFAYTLFRPPTLVFQLAMLQDKSIAASKDREKIESYTRKVTIAWCVFFLCNGTVSAVTAFAFSDFVWMMYNGFISYILMGLLFAVELLIRRRVVGK